MDKENLQKNLADKEAELKRTLTNLEGINWEIKSLQKKLDDKEVKVKEVLANLEESKGEVKISGRNWMKKKLRLNRQWRALKRRTGK